MFHLHLHYYHWIDSTASWLLVPEGFIESISALTCFIKHIYYWKLLFLNNVIMIKPKVVPPRTYVTIAGFGYPVQALWFITPKHFQHYLTFQPFDIKRSTWNVFCALNNINISFYYYHRILGSTTFGLCAKVF